MHEQSQLQKDDSDGPLLNAEPASEATREDDDIEMDTYTYSHAHDSIGPGQASAEEGSPLLRGKTLANEDRHGTQGKNPGRSRRIDWYMNLVAFVSSPFFLYLLVVLTLFGAAVTGGEITY